MIFLTAAYTRHENSFPNIHINDYILARMYAIPRHPEGFDTQTTARLQCLSSWLGARKTLALLGAHALLFMG